MAVKVRLQRQGNTHRPFYHIVVADERKPRDGKFIEKLGYYDPNTEPSTFDVKSERVQYWYSKGANLSAPVKNILKRANVALERNATV